MPMKEFAILFVLWILFIFFIAIFGERFGNMMTKVINYIFGTTTKRIFYVMSVMGIILLAIEVYLLHDIFWTFHIAIKLGICVFLIICLVGLFLQYKAESKKW